MSCAWDSHLYIAEEIQQAKSPQAMADAGESNVLVDDCGTSRFGNRASFRETLRAYSLLDCARSNMSARGIMKHHHHCTKVCILDEVRIIDHGLLIL